MKRRALGGLDSLARRAAQPMTRARALKLAGGLLLAVLLVGPGQDGARMGDDRPVGQLERR
jgi:hypothetical protein